MVANTSEGYLLVMGLTSRFEALVDRSVTKLADDVGGNADELRGTLDSAGTLVSGAMVLLAGGIVVAALIVALALNRRT